MDECVGIGMEIIRGMFENGCIIGECNYVLLIFDCWLIELYLDYFLDEFFKFKDFLIYL